MGWGVRRLRRAPSGEPAVGDQDTEAGQQVGTKLAEINLQQAGDGVDHDAQRKVAVASSEYGGEGGIGVDSPAKTSLLAEHDVLGIGGAGLSGRAWL